MTHATYQGMVYRQKDGSGILVDEHAQEEWLVHPHDMVFLMHQDVIKARPVKTDSKGKQAYVQVLDIVKRAQTHVLGQLLFEKQQWILIPEDKKVTTELLVDPQSVKSHGATAGQIIFAKIITFPDNYHAAVVEVERILGAMDNPGIEIEMAVAKYQLPNEFSVATEKSLKKIPAIPKKSDYTGRVDLRDVPMMTIDGEDARDFDDAVYAMPYKMQGKNVQEWRLLVAIADVAHYVTEGSPLDHDACLRGTSVYFPRKVVPMLPEKLSNGLCSLNPHVDRLCMVCDMVIDRQGQVTAYQFYEAVMNSTARLTYNQVWEALSNAPMHMDADNNTATNSKKTKPKKNTDDVPEVEAKASHVPPAVYAHLKHLYDVFHVLLQARHVRGAMDFDVQETQILTNDEGKITQIVPRSRNDAHRLIEECMLAANVCTANFLQDHQAEALYRIHDAPLMQRLAQLKEFLQTLGIKHNFPLQPSPKDMAQLLEKIQGRPDIKILQQMILRTMQQAIYHPHNIGHYGLAYGAYAHFTSPIRRYPDLLVHRCLKAVMRGEKYQPNIPEHGLLQNIDPKKGDAWQSKKESEETQAWMMLGKHTSLTERRADEASRDVEAWLKCHFMHDKLGQVFTGVVSSVTQFGVFVQLDEFYIEGLIHISELGKDYFLYQERRQEIVGQHSGKVYKIGMPIQIQLARVDIIARKIDFVLYASKMMKDDQPAHHSHNGNNGRHDHDDHHTQDFQQDDKTHKGNKNNKASKRSRKKRKA